MKKFLLILLLCGASIKCMNVDSFSLFDKNTYTVGNAKRLINWGARAGFQGGKMYLGKWLFCTQLAPILISRVDLQVDPPVETSRVSLSNLGKKLLYRGSGGVLFLHGFKGILNEFGYDSPRALFRYLEGK